MRLNCNKDWQAESDAHIMAEYQSIIDDKRRRSAAIKAANRQARDLNERASVMSRVANVKHRRKK